MKIKVCLHNHTHYSKYAINNIGDFRRAFEEGRIDKIAITDHDCLHSARQFQNALGQERIILGEEITTKDGEIIGLYLKKFVPTGLNAERTCEHIKAQGGLVYIPHPFKGKGLKKEVLERIKQYIDVIEVYNGWVHRGLAKPFTSGKSNRQADEWAKENEIPGASATDCHYSTNIGNCYIEMEDFDDKESFLASIRGETKLIKRKNKVNLLSVRAFFKGFLRRDVLRVIK